MLTARRLLSDFLESERFTWMTNKDGLRGRGCGSVACSTAAEMMQFPVARALLCSFTRWMRTTLIISKAVVALRRDASVAVALAATATVVTKVTFDEVRRFSVDTANEKASDGCRS